MWLCCPTNFLAPITIADIKGGAITNSRYATDILSFSAGMKTGLGLCLDFALIWLCNSTVTVTVVQTDAFLNQCLYSRLLRFNRLLLSQSLWLSSAHPTGQNKSVHQRVLLSLSHFFFLLAQHFTDTIEPPIEIGPFYRAPIYWWPIIGWSLMWLNVRGWVARISAGCVSAQLSFAFLQNFTVLVQSHSHQQQLFSGGKTSPDSLIICCLLRSKLQTDTVELVSI